MYMYDCVNDDGLFCQTTISPWCVTHSPMAWWRHPWSRSFCMNFQFDFSICLVEVYWILQFDFYIWSAYLCSFYFHWRFKICIIGFIGFCYTLVLTLAVALASCKLFQTPIFLLACWIYSYFVFYFVNIVTITLILCYFLFNCYSRFWRTTRID